MKTEEKTQVSEVGFEPGTFRSCVEHSIHYAMETPPIPDVLVVLVAPKHINRNVTTTLQSRFTPTPTPRTTLHPKPTRTVRRFFNIFLQNPYLLTWRIWGGNIRTLPIFQHFSSDFLSFNMADLGDNETHIYTTTRCKYFDPCFARATVVRARFLAAAFSDGSYLAHVNGAYLRHVTFCIVRGPPLFIVSPICERGSRAAAHLIIIIIIKSIYKAPCLRVIKPAQRRCTKVHSIPE